MPRTENQPPTAPHRALRPPRGYPRELDSRGFVVLPRVLDRAQLQALRVRVADALAREGLSAGAVDQTPLQLWVNRPDRGLLGRLVSGPYNTVFRGVHAAARAGLFRWKPELQLALNGRGGSPGFASPRRGPRPMRCESWRGRLADEVREMLAAAATNDPGAERVADLANKGPEFFD